MAGRPDVVVVGGGVIGVACALELSRAGFRVLLLERAELASAASGRNHGLLVAPAEPLLGPMAKATLESYLALADETSVPFRLDREPVGYVIVAAGAGEREQATMEADASVACGVRAERLDAAAIRRLEPSIAERFRDGWFLEDGRRLDPASLTVAMAVAAREAGAEIRTHRPVRSLIERDGAVRGVVPDDGPIEAAVVVAAAGPWTTPLLRPLGMALPVVGARGWLVHLAPASPPIARILERAGWHLLPDEDRVPPLVASDVADATIEPDVGTLLQPSDDGSVLVGGSRQLSAVHDPEDDSVPRELVRRAIEVVPALADASVLGAWWGIRPMSPDGRPIVGEAAPGLVLATGHGSQGVILAGGTARLVAAALSGGEPPFDPAPFYPARFLR